MVDNRLGLCNSDGLIFQLTKMPYKNEDEYFHIHVLLPREAKDLLKSRATFKRLSMGLYTGTLILAGLEMDMNADENQEKSGLTLAVIPDLSL